MFSIFVQEGFKVLIYKITYVLLSILTDVGVTSWVGE